MNVVYSDHFLVAFVLIKQFSKYLPDVVCGLLTVCVLKVSTRLSHIPDRFGQPSTPFPTLDSLIHPLFANSEQCLTKRRYLSVIIIARALVISQIPRPPSPLSLFPTSHLSTAPRSQSSLLKDFTKNLPTSNSRSRSRVPAGGTGGGGCTR